MVHLREILFVLYWERWLYAILTDWSYLKAVVPEKSTLLFLILKISCIYLTTKRSCTKTLKVCKEDKQPKEHERSSEN